MLKTNDSVNKNSKVLTSNTIKIDKDFRTKYKL